MSAQLSVQHTQVRLAQHYVHKLKQASRSARWSRGVDLRWLHGLRQDWDQVQHWQAWSARRDAMEPQKARLCIDFTLATSSAIRMHRSPAETLQWAQHALDAARELGDDASERELLYLICRLNAGMGQFETMEPYANELADKSQAAQDRHGQSRAWAMLGQIEEFRGNHAEAEALFLKCVQYWPYDPTATELLSLWQGLGRIALFRGDYEQALIYHIRVLEAAKASRRDVSIGIAHLSLSGVLVYRGDFQTADYHAEQAVDIARKIEFERFIPATLIMLAHTRKWLGKLDDARASYEEALASRKLLAPSNAANALQGRAEVALMQGDADEALIWLEEALALAPQAAPTNICDVRIDLVYVHLRRGDAVAARAALREAVQAALQLGTPHFMTRALAAATMLGQQLGQTERAARWAGVVAQNPQHIQASLFDRSVYVQLESALGATRYAEQFEQGGALSLDGALAEALAELESSPA